MTEHGRGPGVEFPPPLLFLAGFLVGWLLDLYVYRFWPVVTVGVNQTLWFLGATLIVGGLGLAFWGIVTFRRLRTAVYPNRDASTLVIEGPYRFTRNPMYTGMTTAYVGGCLMVKTLWPLVLLPLAVWALYVLVIRREERHLTEAFGDSYRQYQRRVGRWIRF